MSWYGYFGDAGGPSFDVEVRNDQCSGGVMRIDRLNAIALGIGQNQRFPVEQQSGMMENQDRIRQLIDLFDKSDRRGQDLLLAMARIHADRYPKEAK